MERATVASSVIFVTDLDRSVDFYHDVFDCQTTLREGEAALMLAPEGFQIYLIEKGRQAPHPSGGIGVQCLMWATDSTAGLAYFEQALQARGCHTHTHASGGVQFVEGRDPDGIRVIIAQPSPEQRPRSALDILLYAC
ncbi:VOC family protein [Georgenia sp. SYP-B2076]|uniref:VOC family protein n=1 Tax=Georgenia sp. SYP-B2076 TaxID=2495881 RepID=UPI000F8EBFEF|nr:VOC family protein [Georgenia sp. SYP-B2076]